MLVPSQWPPLVEVLKGFLRLQDGSGIYLGKFLERSLSSFSWYLPISNGTKLANLGGEQVGAVQAQL